jgi:TPR repeat protein
LHAFQNELTSLVEGYLLEGSEVNDEVRGRQMQLLSMMLADMSEATDVLVRKLNCETKLTPKELYRLAVSVFRARESVGGDVLPIAAALFQQAGQEGETNSLYTFAQLLRTGQGVETDLVRAADLLSQLAMKGHPYAQFALGGMYYAGSGLEQNFTRAYSLYKVASQNYVAEAFNVLGSMYQHGQGVPEDLEKAVEHYRSGADLGTLKNVLFFSETLVSLSAQVILWPTCPWPAATLTVAE